MYTFEVLIRFLYDQFLAFMSFSEVVLDVFNYTFYIGETAVSVGSVAFGSAFIVFAIATIAKWIPLSPD